MKNEVRLILLSANQLWINNWFEAFFFSAVPITAKRICDSVQPFWVVFQVFKFLDFPWTAKNLYQMVYASKIGLSILKL